jgi:hypothetical protein
MLAALCLALIYALVTLYSIQYTHLSRDNFPLSDRHLRSLVWSEDGEKRLAPIISQKAELMRPLRMCIKQTLFYKISMLLCYIWLIILS